MTGEEFLAWEKKAWGIDYKPEYTDLAGGDIEAGVLLSQIIYWSLPSKNGKSKLTVERQGYLWIAKKRADWWLETRLSEDRLDRAVRLLAKRNLILFKTFHFNNLPALHITLLVSQMLQQMEGVLQAQEAAANQRKAARFKGRPQPESSL